MSIDGRDDALAALRSALRDQASGGSLVIVRGDAGIGKTRLLEVVGRRWRSKGTQVAQVRVAQNTGDRYGVGAVVNMLRQDFDRFRDAGLVDGISALARFHQRQAEDPAVRFPAVAAELNWVFGRIGSLGPVALLIDDVLEIADPVPLLLAARRPGCLVVATMRADDTTERAAALLELADEVIDLDSLGDEHIARLAGEIDDDVHEALRADLGPLYGNPGAVLSTVEHLREQGRLVAVDGRLRLADPGSPISLPEGHELLLRARRLGRLGPSLLAAAARLGTLDIDELDAVADALDEGVAECGRTVDRLVEHGLLVSDDWGRLRCLCPALAAAAGAGERDSVLRPRPSAAESPKPAPSPRRAGRARSWSATETRIVELIGQGLTNRRIGSALGLSEKTVEGHLTRLFAKTGCRSRVELVTTASMAGRPGAAMRGRSAA
ncbi:helix-turn-helix transcriptional regulator [Saccharopolyspora shandongensis]|uniref:helix-turn-helix transcriptional regulator n=1 Tax=Saccharopolyspora shandongensis TaxID=418495 RepID=UPI00340D77BB